MEALASWTEPGLQARLLLLTIIATKLLEPPKPETRNPKPEIRNMLAAANFKFTLDEGTLYGYFSSIGLQTLEIHSSGGPAPVLLHSTPNVMWGRTLHRLLEDYFAGTHVTFNEIPLDLSRGAAFQQRVWMATRAIPYGQTTSYGRLAAGIERPGAARAVGNALGANPVCLVVPCHRVIAANGRLGGFSSGLHWKRLFLEIERPSIGMIQTE